MVAAVRYLAHLPGTGQGDAAEQYIGALRAAGVAVTWTPLVWRDPFGLEPYDGRSIGAFRHDDICNRPLEADCVIVHSTPMWRPEWDARRPARLVSYTTFEADRLPARWVPILDRYDAVLVPSEHDAGVFRRSGVHVPVRVVPHILREPTGAATDRAAPVIDVAPSTFVFYVIGVWTARKALADTVRAFLTAFSAADDVALVVKTDLEDRVALWRRAGGAPGPPAEGQTWWSLAHLLAGRADVPRIRLLTRRLSVSEIDTVHARGNCYVSLSRGEGWGLGAFDAAGAGHPVVVPRWGGPTAYLPAAYPYWVDHRLAPVTLDEGDDWFEAAPDQRWACADVEHASRVLRRIHDDQPAAAEWGHRLQRRIRADYAAEAITPVLLGALAAT